MPRRPLWVALLLSLAGAVVSIVLVRIHAQAHAGITSFCSISDTVNCDRVATSPYSVLLGIPVAGWGVLGYGVAGALAAWGLRRERGDAAFPGLLFVVAAVAVCASIVLAIISEVAIGALCLLCAISWVLTLALLESARRACGGRGVTASVRDGVTALRARPRRTVAVALVGMAGIASAGVAYPRYWERPGPAAAQKPAPAAPPGAPATAAGPGARVVIEYSDYECPFCAKEHEETRIIRETRPDVTIVRRQFPLDAACNPALTKSLHPDACELARAGICAQEQGRFAAMDDALFRNQRARLPPAQVAEQVGLDLERFRACMTSPATRQRLQEDIAAAVRDGVRATPTYVVNGVATAGHFPVELLAPAPPNVTAR
jgi:protein-disulfide isomerase/uncharacterized membrane protein